jgi:hypothetical protein
VFPVGHSGYGAFEMMSELCDDDFLVSGFSHVELQVFMDFICTF